MRTPAPAGGDLELLLRAALAPEQVALAAWQRWRAGTHAPSKPIDRLLPLVVHHLGAHADPTDPLVQRARALHQRARLKGLVLVHQAARVVQALTARGVPTLVLKGTALGLRYYRDLGLRPMDDFDLLVHPADVPTALALLHGGDFTPTEALPAAVWPPRPGAPNLGSAAVTHACGFVDRGGHQLDLHWAALSTHCAPDADRHFWADAVPLTLGPEAVPTRALAPSHELVHIIVHGLRWNAEPAIRWIADAATLLRTSAVDWAAFEDEVLRRGLARAVAGALAALRADAFATIPDAVVERLARAPQRRVDGWREAHSGWPWDRPKPLHVIAFDAWRFAEGLPPAAAAATLGRWAWFRMAHDGRLGTVPRQLFDKLVRQRLVRR